MILRRIAVALAAAGILGTGLVSGCSSTFPYAGGCLVVDEAQQAKVAAYIQRPGNPAKDFIAKGREVNACYATYDAREPATKKKAADPASTDLEFSNAWKSDADAAIAGYAILGMPKTGQYPELAQATRTTVLDIRGGRSYFLFQGSADGQDRRLNDHQAEVDAGTPPSKVTFVLPRQ